MGIQIISANGSKDIEAMSAEELLGLQVEMMKEWNKQLSTDLSTGVGSFATFLRLFTSYALFSHFPYFGEFRGVGLCQAKAIERNKEKR